MEDPFKLSGGARHLARIAAVQAVYQIENNPDNRRNIVHEFSTNHFKSDCNPIAPDLPLFKSIVNYLQDDLYIFDSILKDHLGSGWTLERLPSVSRAILRCATYEISHELITPSPIIFNEYAEVSKGFLDTKDVGFINGVLNKIAEKLRA